jgi:acetolactate synthase-1/2/3 large subunit
VFVERVPYVVDQAVKVLAGLKHIILIGSKMPAAFFAYPDKPSLLAPRDAVGHVLARPEEDLIGALEALADEVGARSTPAPVTDGPPPKPATGAITSETLDASLAALLPENAIVVDEAVKTGRRLLCADPRGGPARLALQHGRLDRHGHAGRDRRGGRLPRPQGGLPRR